MSTISVILPTRNRLRYLPTAVDSILSQVGIYIECIVTDGASTDGTQEYLASLDSRVRWVSEPDGGHVDAIMKGWQMSHGEYLAWLNDDDFYLSPSALATLGAYLDEHPDVDVVYGDYALSDEWGNVGPILRSGEWDLSVAAIRCTNILPQAASLIRRSALERVNWLDYDFEYCKDHELWLRIGLHGKLCCLHTPVAAVRICPGISNHGYKTADGKVRLTRKFFTLPNLPPNLQGEGVRRRALAIAHLKGAAMIYDNERDWPAVVSYLVKAFRLDLLYSIRRFSRKLFKLRWA